MAALYLHNAIFIPESPAADAQFPHARTLSSGTLRTVTSDSHLTEHLLQPAPDSQSLAFQDLLSRQPTHPDGPDSGWDMRLSLDGHPQTTAERRDFRETMVRRRLSRLRLAIIFLQVVMAVWATYGAIRQFIALSLYKSSIGQAFSVALGTSHVVSVAYLACANLMIMARPWLVNQDIPLRYIRLSENIFRSLATLFFLTPAVINFIIVFVFKINDNDTQLSVLDRCALDVDLIWSVRRQICPHAEDVWASWVGVTGVRLFLSLVVVVLFHTSVMSFQHSTRQSSSGKRYTTRPRRHHRRRKFPKSHTQSTSHQSQAGLITSPPMSMTSSGGGGNTNTVPATLQPVRNNANNAQRRSPTPSPVPLARMPSDPTSHSSHHSSSSAQRLSTGSISPPQDQQPTYFTESDVEKLAPLRLQVDATRHSPEPQASTSSTTLDDAQEDQKLHSFVDRFRSLVSQISREAEEAIEFAQPDSESHLYTNNTYDMGPQLPSAVLGYDEFGRPYPGDDHVRILNGYVRKMPTIESIGSRELGSMRSTNWDHERMERLASLHTLSRPPTQLTMHTTTTTTDYGVVINPGGGGFSGPPSRSNSISWTPVSPFAETEFVASNSVPPSPVDRMIPQGVLARHFSTRTAHTDSTSHTGGTVSSAHTQSSSSSSRGGGDEGTAEGSGPSYHTAESPTSPTSPMSIVHPYRTASPVPLPPR